MPVDVSRCVCHAAAVDMNDEERAALAALVTSERVRQYGTRSAAYRAAGLNAMTWQKIEDGQPVREDRRAAAVRTLWPESGGDWRRVSVSSDRPLSDYEDRAILGEIETRLDERRAAARGDAAATTRAAGSAATDMDALRDAILEAFAQYTRDADAARTGAGSEAVRAARLAEVREYYVTHVTRLLAQSRPDSSANAGGTPG